MLSQTWMLGFPWVSGRLFPAYNLLSPQGRRASSADKWGFDNLEVLLQYIWNRLPMEIWTEQDGFPTSDEVESTALDTSDQSLADTEHAEDKQNGD